MRSDRLKTLLAPSVRKRIAGGFAVVLVLLVALAGVTMRLVLPLDAGAILVREDSARAEAAALVSLQVGDARARVVQYALSATMADQKAAQDSLARLDQAIAQATTTGGQDDGGLAALAGSTATASMPHSPRSSCAAPASNGCKPRAPKSARSCPPSPRRWRPLRTPSWFVAACGWRKGFWPAMPPPPAFSPPAIR